MGDRRSSGDSPIVRTSSRPSLRDFSQQVMKERKDL
eukprot:COSAG06_NODE_62754_length_264_cov_0.630303_1_plen_35_part_10